MGVKVGFSQAMRELIGDAAEKLDVSTDEARLYPEQLLKKNQKNSAELDQPEKAFAFDVALEDDFPESEIVVPDKKEEVATMEKAPTIASIPESTFYSNVPDEIVATTVISKGTIINGDITSNGDIELCGDLRGNIKTKGGLRVSGGLVGDAVAKEMTFLSCEVRGNLACETEVNIDESSVIYGNVEAENIVLNGKIRGNIKVKKDAILQDNAILWGNLEAGSISIDQGAKLEGEVKIIFDKACKDYFDEKVSISDAKKNSLVSGSDSKSTLPKTVFSM